MTIDELQVQCELGQRELFETNYLQAERLLAAVEQSAWQLREFDTLARLYMPLQEARRQRRLRCGEGTVCLEMIAQGPTDHVSGRHVVENYPFGQLLVAGWGSIEPAVQVRQLQQQHELYVETFLGAVFPTHEGNAVAILPNERAVLPSPETRAFAELKQALPINSLVIRAADLPAGARTGDATTFARVMNLWEGLHLPFLRRADEEKDLLRRIVAYRRTIEVDYACELAHQKLSDAARELDRVSCSRQRR